MTPRSARRIPIGVCIALLLPAVAWAQVDRVVVDDVVAGRDGERRVELYLRVLDKFSQPVGSIDAGDIVVSDAGEKIETEDIEVESLGASGRGVTCVIAFDTSPTMKGETSDRARAAALEFIRVLDPRDKVALIAFSDDVRVLSNFGDAKASAEAKLESLGTDVGALQTDLHDGVNKAVELIRIGENLPRRAFVIVFSDGEDSGSSRSLGQVTEYARGGPGEPAIQIFTIGYSRFGGKGLQFLEKLAKDTGGEYRQAVSPLIVRGFFDSIRRQMKESLVVSYPGSMDGDVHEIEVVIDGKTGQRAAKYPDMPYPILPWILAGLGVLVVVAAGLLVLRGRSSGRLVFVTGPLAGRTVRLKGSSVRIGAFADNDIVLVSETVSRHHAVIKPRGRRADVQDLESMNGTYVNDKLVTRGTLERGDTVRFADVEATYE